MQNTLFVIAKSGLKKLLPGLCHLDAHDPAIVLVIDTFYKSRADKSIHNACG